MCLTWMDRMDWIRTEEIILQVLFIHVHISCLQEGTD